MAYSNESGGCLCVTREGIINVFPAASGITIYDGTAVLLSGGAALWQPVDGALFAGVAASSGSSSIQVYSAGVFRFAGSSLSASDTGKTAYLDTGSSGGPHKIVTTAPTGAGAIVLALGTIVSVPSADCAEVCITGFALRETAKELSETAG